jgi:hypothetical protein
MHAKKHAGRRLKFPLLLSEFNKKLNIMTDFHKTHPLSSSGTATFGQTDKCGVTIEGIFAVFRFEL